MPPSFQVIDDTVVPHGGSYDTITPREQTVRNAMLVVTIVAPILGSFIIWLFSRKGWSYRSSWSYPRLAILWFWSVAIFGTLVFYQRGTTNRTTFVFAILHTRYEICLPKLPGTTRQLVHSYQELHKWGLGYQTTTATEPTECYMAKPIFPDAARNSLALAGLWGFVLLTATLALPNISLVFLVSSVLGGANDFVVVILLAYGKKWLYAAGALFHVLSAVWVFADSAIFINVVLYNTLIFISLWLHIALTAAAILRDAQTPDKGSVRLPLEAHHGDAEGHSVSNDQRTDVQNPMRDVEVPPCALRVIIAISLLGSSFITALIYLLA
ncbi:hypothetical protein C8J57DRAFT_1723118 [Mycena rebaudengoi]|nr:hypothetical protein C8J57DRAFT_1723118 [Mycena rebaudengoi]